MKLFDRKTVTNIDITFPNRKPTIFEDRLTLALDRKIASVAVDGQGMRLSAFRENTSSAYVWWQLEDSNGNKMSGTLQDLESALRIVREEL